MKNPKMCSERGCELPFHAKGMCYPHYTEFLKTRSDVRPYFTSPEEAFEARTERQGDCIVWKGATNGSGYGNIWVTGQKMLTHRYAWERINGPIPEGLLVNHRCWNKTCVNDEHLELVTNGENMAYRPGAQRNSSTGERNVYWNKNNQCWEVKVQKNGKGYVKSGFKKKEDAVEYASLLREDLFGRFAGNGQAAYNRIVRKEKKEAQKNE